MSVKNAQLKEETLVKENVPPGIIDQSPTPSEEAKSP